MADGSDERLGGGRDVADEKNIETDSKKTHEQEERKTARPNCPFPEEQSDQQTAKNEAGDVEEQLEQQRGRPPGLITQFNRIGQC